MTTASLLNNFQAYAEAIIDKYQMPAVSLAVWHNNQLHQAAAGILNISTDVEATTDSIFQIGSITKVFTTCLIMQLLDEGRVDLDAPVKTYLRDFEIADVEATNTITVRQLLNHTNGIAGDYFPNDAQVQDNAIARYVDRINLIPLVHTPGTMFSYSNAAFVVAGRLVEILSGMPWHQAMAERIYKPLGMAHAIADPREILRYRAAIGHFPDPDNPSQWHLSSNCFSVRGLAPAGTNPMMSAADLITFARAHLNVGKLASAKPWLSRKSIQLMQTPTVALPPNSKLFDRHWGLGWGLLTEKHSGNQILWHVGQTVGQTAMLRLFPNQNTAFAILLNGVKPGVIDAITNDLMGVLVDIDGEEPEPIEVKLSQTTLASYTGTFDSFGAIYHVAMKEDPLDPNPLTVSQTDKVLKTISELSLRPLDKHIFAAYTDQGVRLSNIAFICKNNNSEPTHLFIGGRLNRRIQC